MSFYFGAMKCNRRGLKVFCLGAFCLILQCCFVKKPQQIIYPPPVLGMEYPDFISACELRAHKNELVYTRFIYSGIDEYWGLTTENHCNDIDAELNIPDNVEIKPDDLKLMKEVHENYWKEYLIIDLIGTFEEPGQNGFGHLGSNNSRFTVKYFVSSYIVQKKSGK